MRTGSLEGLIWWFSLSESERNKKIKEYDKQKMEMNYGKKNNI